MTNRKKFIFIKQSNLKNTTNKSTKSSLLHRSMTYTPVGRSFFSTKLNLVTSNGFLNFDWLLSYLGRTYLGDLGMQMNPRNCQNLNLQSRITVVITYILFLVIPNPKSKFEMRNKYFSFYGFLKVSIYNTCFNFCAWWK